jgi:hypothetical protein
MAAALATARRRAASSAVPLAVALVIVFPSFAVAAYPADPAADGNPAFCAPKDPIQDFGLLGLPPVREVPEFGKVLGRGAVNIYGGWDRVMPEPRGFGYGFSESNYSGTVELNWNVTAELWAVDRDGNEFQRFDREELFIGRLDAADQPNIEVDPPRGRRGFYRFDMEISSKSGKVLGSFGAYFKVVRSFWKVRLGLAHDVVRPGQRVFSRLENYGSETVDYGESFSIQRREGGRWVGQPDLTPNVWLLWLGTLSPGRTGLCNSIDLPASINPGRYRFLKRVGLGPRRKSATLTAPFTVQG